MPRAAGLRKNRPFGKMFIVMKSRIFFLFLPLCALMISCNKLPEPFEEPKKKQPITLKVINYNLWHGLGTGFLKREELEPEDHRKARFQEQINLLKGEKPDVLFLQELNPVSSRSGEIAKALGMSHTFQRTNCGMSLLGMGFPINLNVGIAILVKPPLQIKKITGHKLSGPGGFCGSGFSFQYSEFRFALFALAHHPKYGSFLLANTHFHHGAEWSSKVREQLDSWEKDGVLTASQKNELKGEIDNSNKRREQELENLFSKINEIQVHYEGLPLILAGDFNATVESPVYKKIIETHNLKDTAGDAAPTPYTWDPEQNKKNHQYTEKFGVSVPTFDKTKVENFFKEYDKRQRRIDYIFVSPEIEVQSYSLFANQPNNAGLVASDHFGVIASLGLNEEGNEEIETSGQTGETETGGKSEENAEPEETP